MKEECYNEKNKRELLIRLAQFRCNEKAQVIKKELNYFFIKQALFFDDPNGLGMKINEIISSLQLHCPLANLSEERIVHILNQLEKEKSISKLGEDRYLLTKSERETIEAAYKLFEKARKEFSNSLFGKALEDFDLDKNNIKKEEFTALFETFFAEVLFKYGHSVAKHFISITNQSEEAKLFVLPDLDKIAQNTIERANNPELKKLPSHFLIRIFQNPDDYLVYLDSLSRLFIFIEVLNADPDLIKFEKSQLEGHTLYLDTNILIPLLCKNDPHHKLSARLIEISKLFNFDIVYSVNTKEEFLRLLDRSNNLFQSLRQKHNRLQDLLENLDNVFINDFAKRHSGISKRWNKWNGYYHMMRSEINNLESNYKIKLVDIDKKIFNDERFNELKGYVHTAHQLKGESVQKHDTYHILLIKKLRTDTDLSILGSRCWFVTDDSTLKTVEKKFKDTSRFHSSIQIEKILTILDEYTYLSGIQDQSQVVLFLDMLDSNIQASIPMIRTEDLIDAADDWLDFKELSNERIIQIFTDKNFKKKLDISRGKKDKTTKEIALSRIIGELKKEKVRFEEEYNTLQKHVIEKDKEISEKREEWSKRIAKLEERIKYLEQKRKIYEEKIVAKERKLKKLEMSKSLEKQTCQQPLLSVFFLFIISILFHILVGITLNQYLHWDTQYIIVLLIMMFGLSCGGIGWMYKNRLI